MARSKRDHASGSNSESFFGTDFAMGYNDLTNLNHDQELAVSLGNLVVSWAYAESSLVCVLARVSSMNINMAMYGYYRIPTFEARRKFIQALMIEWKTTSFDKDAIAKEVDGLSDLSLSRNDWIHGVWCNNDEKPETVIFDFRRHEDKGRRKPVKAADVRNHNEAVVKRAREIDRLIRRAELTGD